MADRCQAIQRNLYTTEASQFRPDFKRNYGDDYIRGLSFVGTDVPQHARNTQYTHFYDSLHPNSHVEKDLGRTGGSIVPRNRQQRDMNMIPSRGMGKTQSLADTIYMGTDSLTQRRSPSPKISTTPMTTCGGLIISHCKSPRNPHMPVGFRRAPQIPRSDQERLANDAFITRQFGRSVEYLTLAIAVDPGNDTLFAKRAAAKCHMGLFQDAEADAVRAVQLNSASSKARFRLKTLREYLGNLKNAPPGWDGGHVTVLDALTPEEFKQRRWKTSTPLPKPLPPLRFENNSNRSNR
jgi:hypothetical protein